jgi:hypothetical protein
MIKLYSYNQLKMLYGDNDIQVINIKKYLDKLGDKLYTNYSLEAFKRLEVKNNG